MPKSIYKVHPNIQIHADGDIYVLNKKTKMLEYVGFFYSEDGDGTNRIKREKNWKKFINAFKK